MACARAGIPVVVRTLDGETRHIRGVANDAAKTSAGSPGRFLSDFRSRRENFTLEEDSGALRCDKYSCHALVWCFE
jgi:hypothetical protein